MTTALVILGVCSLLLFIAALVIALIVALAMAADDAAMPHDDTTPLR